MADAGRTPSTSELGRIERARNLLLNPHYSSSEIAEHLGFLSLTHFNRTFKHVTGESPVAYQLSTPKPCSHSAETRPMPMKATPAPRKLHVLILYSDRISGQEAMRACDHVLRQIDHERGDEHWFEFRLWRLDLLDQRDIRAQATRDVAESDIIVVSVADERACSESFQRWAKNWPAPRQSTRRALVAFQPSAAASPSSRSVDLLRELAVEKGMDLISPEPRGASTARALPVQCKEPSPEPQGPLPAPTRRAEFTHHFLGAANPGFRGWGINE
jgi:hypothetical protein